MKYDSDFKSNQVSDLDHVFADRWRDMVELVKTQYNGLKLVPITTRRGPRAQGRMWASSRTEATVASRISSLESLGCAKLARTLKLSDALTDRPRTQRFPGASWHQWGEAVDFAIVASDYEVIFGSHEMVTILKLAPQVGLHSPHSAVIKEMGHLQLRTSSPVDEYGDGSWPKLETALGQIFNLD